MSLKFSLIETHLIDGLRNEMIAAETPEIEAENRRMIVPGFCVLIRHDTLGCILYDTGISNNWEETWTSQMKSMYTLRQNYDIKQKLLEFGLTPDDVDLVILSHLHYDHAGNVRLFQKTAAGRKILISGPEAREAFVAVNLDDTGYFGAYNKHEFLNLQGIGYELMEEDTWLADDLYLFIQNGHTPGVIGMLLKTKEHGNFIFPSDAVYMQLNFGPPIKLPGIVNNPGAFLKNIDRLHKMKEEYNAEIIFGHDYNDYKKSPHWYE
jgi:glyoxylase-like metal-dependent hydrolase (beta-lactamase superfamily II)